MTNELYRKLVDLYAGHELPTELEDQMELAAFQDLELSHDMATLRRTVEALQDQKASLFTEESHQRILMMLYSRCGNVKLQTEAPAHLQYNLPILV